MKGARPFLRRSLALAPLPLLQALLRRDVVTLFYHAVSDAPLAHLRHLYEVKSPAQFEQDLLYLRRHYDLLSYEQLEHRLRHPGRTRRPGVLLTFDDGLSECYTTVRPLLLAHRVPCLFFVTTDFLDNRRMFYRHKVSLCIDRVLALTDRERDRLLQAMRQASDPSLRDAAAFTTWLKSLHDDEATIDQACRLAGLDIDDLLLRTRPYLTTDQVRQLAADGFAIGSHSTSHRLFDALPRATIEQEVLESTTILRDLTGRQAIPFSIPFSSDGFDPAILRHLVDAQPSIGLVFGGDGIRRDESYLVHRVPCDQPGPPREQGSNLPRLLRAAWVREIMRPGRRQGGDGRNAARPAAQRPSE